MPKPLVNKCCLCGETPVTHGHGIYCECGLSVYAYCMSDAAKKWNKLTTGNASLMSKILMQRKEIEALSKRTAC